MSHRTDFANLPSQPDETVILRSVVAQHIADGLTSGSPAAEALARSLMTELDAAGIDISTHVNALRAAGA
jgi:hypothetical protein